MENSVIILDVNGNPINNLNNTNMETEFAPIIWKGKTGRMGQLAFFTHAGVINGNNGTLKISWGSSVFTYIEVPCTVAKEFMYAEEDYLYYKSNIKGQYDLIHPDGELVKAGAIKLTKKLNTMKTTTKNARTVRTLRANGRISSIMEKSIPWYIKRGAVKCTDSVGVFYDLTVCDNNGFRVITKNIAKKAAVKAVRASMKRSVSKIKGAIDSNVNFINAFFYDGVDKLTVEFRGNKQYVYEGVSASVVSELKNSNDHNKFYHNVIKGYGPGIKA